LGQSFYMYYDFVIYSVVRFFSEARIDDTCSKGPVSLASMGNPPISFTTGRHLRERVFKQDRLGDRCTLKVARRLRQDTAIQGGISNERNVGLDQENALHVRF
jgi:hypothetical protein